MSNSAKIAVALGVLCALLVGFLVGGRASKSEESERYYARANRVLDKIAPDPSASRPEVPEKERLLAAAKDISIDVISYESDHDDTLPDRAGFAEELRPYTTQSKPESVAYLPSVEWSFARGKVNSTNLDVSEHKPIGMLKGVTGDAVLYLDGHAKWIPK